MPKFEVVVSDSAWYPIEAENEEEAIQWTWEWWLERKPIFQVKEVSENSWEENMR